MPNLGSYKVVVRPALVVLVVGSVIAALARPVTNHWSFAKLPGYGYANPDSWRFGFRDGAHAKIESLTNGDDLTANQNKKIPTYNSDKGFNIVVDTAGKSPDGVFLRNAFDRDQPGFPKDTVHLTFEASAPNPFPVIITVRDGRPGNDASGPLWSGSETITGAWNKYDVSIPVSSLLGSTDKMAMVALQLGGQNGTVGFRNIEIK